METKMDLPRGELSVHYAAVGEDPVVFALEVALDESTVFALETVDRRAMLTTVISAIRAHNPNTVSFHYAGGHTNKLSKSTVRAIAEGTLGIDDLSLGS
jgi:hypothetical protein